MERRYQIGDRVVIREDLRPGEYDTEYPEKYSTCSAVTAMLEYAGKTVTITDYLGSCRYLIDADRGNWLWVAEMFDGLEDDGSQYELAMDELF